MFGLLGKGLRAHGTRLTSTALSVVLGVALLTGSFSFIDGIRAAQAELVVQASSGIDLIVGSD